MSLTITIAGAYLDPEGKPLPEKIITFESLYNSSQTQLKNKVQLVTDKSANYSISLVPNFYNVCELDDKGRSKWLGNIQIFADSPSGTLNEYLTAFKVDQAQPGILAEMEEILGETKKAASTSVIPEFEAPGFIGFFSIYTNASGIFLKPGDEVPASSLSYSGISNPAAFMIQSYSHPAGGTWRSLGFACYQGKPDSKAVLPFQRVDTAPNANGLLRSARAGVRNCVYSAPDKTSIDCEIYNGGSWHPFTASFSDNTTWGREIFSNAQNGLFGVVADYIPQS